MPHLKTRDVSAIAIGAALWGVLNSVFSPIVFRLTGLPVLCDLIGFTVLTVAAWWIRKPGAVTAIGLIATVINFAFPSSQALIFLGFTAASFVYDILARVTGYQRAFKKPTTTMATAVAISAISAAVAGAIIGAFFMAGSELAVWGGVAGWAALHAAGGLIGGAIGGTIVNMLISRKAVPSNLN